MTCVHKVKWSVKRPEDCRFHLSVSHYKDRIVAPDEYTGPTEVTPSDQTQVLQTRDRLVREDITVTGITGTQTITENGTYDVVDKATVIVDTDNWDGILLPPEDGGNFYGKHVALNVGETLIIEGKGAGQRWMAVEARHPIATNYGQYIANGNVGQDPSTYKQVRYYITTTTNTVINVAGYEWTGDGGRRTDSYGFRGEFMKYKVVSGDV